MTISSASSHQTSSSLESPKLAPHEATKATVMALMVCGFIRVVTLNQAP